MGFIKKSFLPRLLKLVIALARRIFGDSRGELHRLGGAAAKIAQLLELSFAGECSTTTFIKVTPQKIHEVLDRELGVGQDLISIVEDYAVEASMSTVYFATLKSGAEVALKAKRPDIEDLITSDTKIFQGISLFFQLKKPPYKSAAFEEELKKTLLEESNFLQEQKTAQTFYRFYQNDPTIHIPVVYPELCTNNLLVLERLRGEPLSRKEENATRAIAESLTRFILTGWLSTGLAYADPNPANFLVLPTGQLGILDFGCVKTLSSRKICALRTILMEEPGASLIEEFCHLGFNRDLLEPIETLLPQVAELLREPFRQEKSFDPTSWHLKSRLKDILGPGIWNFRLAGPPHLIWFVRTIYGLTQLLRRLDTPVKWRSIVEKLPRPETTILTDYKNIMNKRTSVENGSDEHYQIVVKVSKAGEDYVQVKLPYSALERLEDLMPENVVAMLTEEGTSVGEVVRVWKNSGFSTGEIFARSVGEKYIVVNCLKV